MHALGRELFYELLRNATVYQEFGAGGSTAAALMFKNIQYMHTIESSLSWINLLANRDDVDAANQSKRLNLVHGNVGPTKAVGFPIDLQNKTVWPDYAGKHAESSTNFDLIFVDGRFRVS